MSSNEIANHIEAVCWIKFGPGTPGVVPPPLYFRSQNGFIDRIGVADVTDPTAAPLFLVQLDRYYTRRETAVFCFPPTTGDATTIPPAAPTFVVYPAAPQFTPLVTPVDSRVFYGEIPPPAAPADLEAVFETYNAFFVAPFALGDESAIEGLYSDICIQVIRVPRGTTGPESVTYKQLAFAPP